MAQSWIRRLLHGNEPAQEQRSRVWELDAQATGIPANQNIQSARELITVPYKGTISPELAGKIFAALPVARACADIIANYASSAPLRTYYRGGATKKWKVEESLFPAPMIRWVNRRLTAIDYIARLSYFLSLYENAYVAIEQTPESDRHFSEFSLYPMNPAYVTVIPEAVMGVKYFEYKVPGAPKPIYYPESQVMHIGGFSPFDDYYGLLKFNALDYDIQKERYAKKYLTQFFSNAASFSGVLTLNGEGEEEIQKIRSQIEENYRGSTKAFRILVLEEGQTFEQVKSTGIEVSSMPIVQDSNAMMQMVFGVPVGILTGVADDLEAVEELFWNRTVTPLLERIAQMHTKKICMPISQVKLKMEFDTRHILALKRQKLNLAKLHVAYMNTGAMLPNEVREELSLDPLSGENQEFGELAVPVFNAKNGERMAALKPGGNPAQAGGTSPSLTMPGSGGGRDQSSDGEAQLIDESGKKELVVPDDLLEKLFQQALDGKGSPAGFLD